MGVKKIKVFIAEDSSEWLKFHIANLRGFFGEDCVEIDYSYSAMDGLRKISANSDIVYDLVISDLEMEEIIEEKYAGIYFIKRAKEFSACIDSKFIVISGSHDIEEVASLLNVDFIPKYSLSSNPLLINYKLEELFKT